MNKKEDARVIRTKAKLFTSFKQLLAEKTFEDITINEICIRSNICILTHVVQEYNPVFSILASRKLI